MENQEDHVIKQITEVLNRKKTSTSKKQTVSKCNKGYMRVETHIMEIRRLKGFEVDTDLRFFESFEKFKNYIETLINNSSKNGWKVTGKLVKDPLKQKPIKFEWHDQWKSYSYIHKT